MGESAGAASILHQLTAFGNSTSAPFQRAILQSPAFQVQSNGVLSEDITQEFLTLLNVSTISQARALDSAALIAANSKQIAKSPYGSFTFGPALDTSFVPALPGQLFATGTSPKM